MATKQFRRVVRIVLSTIALACAVATVQPVFAGECGEILAGPARIVSVTEERDGRFVGTEPPELVYLQGSLRSGPSASGPVRIGDAIEYGLIENTGTATVVLTVETGSGLETFSLPEGAQVAIGIRKYVCRCICDCNGGSNNADLGSCAAEPQCANHNNEECIDENGEQGTLSNCNKTWVPGDE